MAMCWLSTISPPCRPGCRTRSADLASGGGFAIRQLYTDQDEVLFDAARPIILNGIEDVVTRPDLADRGLFLTLPPDIGGATPAREGAMAGDSSSLGPACWEPCSMR